MRKPLLTLLAAATLLAVGCDKDDDSGSTPAPTPATGTADEGIYAPAAKIRAINNPDGSSETWLWNGDTLQSIDNNTYCGGGSPMMVFGYQEGTLRLASIAVNRTDLRADLSLTYNGTAIRNALIRIFDDADVAHPVEARLTHNAAGKISQVDLDVANADLLMLMPIASQYTGIELPFEMPALDPSIFTSNSISAHLLWNGDNVRSMVVNFSANVNTTIGALPVAMLQQLLGNTIGTYVHDNYADRVLPLTVSMADTIDFTYETGHLNPLHGFIGRVDISALASDNVSGQYSHGSLRIQGTVDNIPFVGSYNIDRTMPMPDTTVSYTYEYEDSLPYSRTDHEGNVTTFIY